MSLEIVEADSLPLAALVKPTCDARIYVDTEKYIDDKKCSIYLQLEPEAINAKKQYLLENYKKYTTIFTFDKDVLMYCPNARRFTFYTITWLQEKDYTNIDTNSKQFKISCLVGAKRMTTGHDLRLSMYFHQTLLHQYPFTFFRSCVPPHLPEITQNPFLESREIHAKYVLFHTFQFHMAIENSRQDNYFTEKLIDCLITKTIPIYYGCPNIEEYFDTRGWIILESGTPDELLEKCSILSPSYYHTYTQTIEENYKRALLWKENMQRFNDALYTVPGYI